AVPYADAAPETDALADTLRLLDGDYFGRYRCVLFDAPPAATGEGPRKLLRAADELVVVLRAEPLAYRTLPKYLAVVRTVEAAGARVRMRGLLLTLPPGERPGGRWERQLRARFGPYLLPQTIPY